MNEGNITVVDVIATSDGYALSRPAQDLYIAYEVVRRHIDDNGVRHYAQMSSAKITEDGYEFVFETGDTFTCASHEDLPTSETLSDELAGGGSSGGGALIVTDTSGTLDKTFAEIAAANVANTPVIIWEFSFCRYVVSINAGKFGNHVYALGVNLVGEIAVFDYAAASEDDYPELSA